MKLNDLTLNFTLNDTGIFNMEFFIDDSITSNSFWGGNDFTLNHKMIFQSYSSGICDHLFICECGSPGCANIYNECCIIHQSELVIWLIPKTTKSFNVELTQLNYSFDIYNFDKHKYRNILRESAFEILNKPNFSFCKEPLVYTHYSYQPFKDILEKIKISHERYLNYLERKSRKAKK